MLKVENWFTVYSLLFARLFAILRRVSKILSLGNKNKFCDFILYFSRLFVSLQPK